MQAHQGRVRIGLFAALLIGSLSLDAGQAQAGIDVHVNKSQQRMQVTVDGAPFASWPVSTARSGYHTPSGTFHPYSLQLMHYSSIYENAPMPHSMFFHGGYAIHGTLETRYLGRAASHGCVRLAPGNAKVLYDLVREHGAGNTTITIAD